MSLVLALLLFWRLGSHHWFFGDDWDFLVRRGLTGAELGLFEPHNEHWSTAPILVYRALFSLFGVSTYAPYYLVVLLLHLTATHVVWRLLRQAGTSPWLATALVLTFLTGGAGADFLWAFNIGFVGALLFGLIVLLLANRADPRQERLAVATAVVGLTWAGVVVPFVAAAGIVAWFRRGWRAGLRLVIVPAAVYLVWLQLVGHKGLGAHEVTKRGLLLVPSYAWRGLVTTVEGYTVFEGGGAVILLALGYVLLRRRGWTWTPAAIAPAGALGAIMLFLTIAPGRVALGIEQADAARYHYLAWALLLPSIGVCLHQLAQGDRARQLALVLLVVACCAQGLDSLVSMADSLEDRGRQHHRLVVAAAELAASGEPVFPLPPHPVYAPDLQPPSRMVRLLRSHGLSRPPDITLTDRLSVAGALQVRLPPLASLPLPSSPDAKVREVLHATALPAPPGCVTFRPQGGRPEVAVAVSQPSGVRVSSVAGGELQVVVRDPATGTTADPNLILALQAGSPASIDLASRAFLAVLRLPESGDTTICGILRAT